MKINRPIRLAILGVILFSVSSCRKDFTCNCETEVREVYTTAGSQNNTTGQYYPGVHHIYVWHYETVYQIKNTEKKAKRECDDHTSSYSDPHPNGTINYSTNCELQ